MVYDYNENVYDSSECNYLHPFFSILQSQISNENMCSNLIFRFCFSNSRTSVIILQFHGLIAINVTKTEGK